MFLRRHILSAVTCVLVTAPVVHAQVFEATFSGTAEFPSNGSPGTGSVTIAYAAASKEMTIDASFSGLTAGVTAAHIHCCTTTAASNASVATQVPSFSGFPQGVMAGTYHHVFDMAWGSSYNSTFVSMYPSLAQARDALIAGMGNGAAYFNIHTTAFPGGEIRGVLSEQSIFGDGFDPRPL